MSVDNIFVVLGNQLFHPNFLKEKNCNHVFMAEDFGLCTYQKHHKLKIYLFLCAMREYKEELKSQGIEVSYFTLNEREDKLTYCDFLVKFCKEKSVKNINCFEIEDRFFEKQMLNSFKSATIDLKFHKSPMFMFTREEFHSLYSDKKEIRLGNFYKIARKNNQILLDDEQKPLGGKWSYDDENRKKIPASVNLPIFDAVPKSRYHDDILDLIKKYFSEHPGSVDNIWFPVTRAGALNHFEKFVETRMMQFGPYEDAMVNGENFLFHSCISPLLNIGLLTPREVIQIISNEFVQRKLPLNSVEGFIRQILGWREFIRGIYQLKGAEQEKSNYFNHKRKLSNTWYDAKTGIFPLDDCIKMALADGYNHHIPRLMVICNIMNMSEIDPSEIYRWFMEMYIDSSDWVMVPNVFGMATFADGGIMSTKPYTCSSNYILKMSNYKKGEWCNAVDGLYWRFVENNRNLYESNIRLSFQVQMLNKMDPYRKKTIFDAAEEFISKNTK